MRLCAISKVAFEIPYKISIIERCAFCTELWIDEILDLELVGIRNRLLVSK